MSYVALATDQFDQVVGFYGNILGFPVVERWDRPNGRGMRFDLDGMRLEILDNGRERRPLDIGDPADRIHIVVEVDDIDEAYFRISVDAPAPTTVSWGARLFQLRDPDGVAVTYLQWLRPGVGLLDRIHGQIDSGLGRGQYFTQLDWARQQFKDRLGIDPFPGTLNVIVKDPADFAAWVGLRSTQGIRIDNPGCGPNDCDARCYPVSVDGAVDAAIVLPEVETYPECQIEIIAPVGLRNVLGKRDGDAVTLEIVGDGKLLGMKERSQVS